MEPARSGNHRRVVGVKPWSSHGYRRASVQLLLHPGSQRAAARYPAAEHDVVVAGMLERGIDPPVWRSANVPDGDAFNVEYIAKYSPLIKNL